MTCFQNCHIAASAKKIARCVRINRWLAGVQIRRDWRIKSPGVSLALIEGKHSIYGERIGLGLGLGLGLGKHRE